MAGGQLPHTLEDRVGIGKIPAPEIAAGAAQVEGAPDLGMSQQGSHLGAEDEPPVALGVVEGFLPRPITRAEQAPRLCVPNRKREHARKQIEELRTPGPVRFHENFGVGFCAKLRA